MLRVLQLTKGYDRAGLMLDQFFEIHNSVIELNHCTLHKNCRSYLTVSFRLNRRSFANIPGLQIRLMEPGFCGRSMTNFESNCYTTGSVRRNLTAELAAMSADSGVMRLASFSSSAALQNFVTESKLSEPC
ncbi:hypothetical protein BOX15_Mlig013553g1 [Macrostomum lignano]|uniref:Uncharacterized protein n=1 Tax=Macrostomum lignano TaxID=282301 RepID=A0A267DC09_9PLAT|nr:hypothetical protein BOX15_Mlig013553g1 [Macrostomum lignano]